MNVEEQLKELIIRQYKSIRAFTQSIGVPYSTIDTMLKKGIIGTGIGTMVKVCNALNISADYLVKGRLVSVCIDDADSNYLKSDVSMNFLEKLDNLMQQQSLNKNELSKACDIPYTTIDGWYKKGYEGLKLTTLKKLASFFNTSLDFWAIENPTIIEQPSTSEYTEAEKDIIKNYRLLDERGKTVVLDVLIRELQYSCKEQIEATEIINTLKGLAAEVQVLNQQQNLHKK